MGNASSQNISQYICIDYAPAPAPAPGFLPPLASVPCSSLVPLSPLTPSIQDVRATAWTNNYSVHKNQRETWDDTWASFGSRKNMVVRLYGVTLGAPYATDDIPVVACVATVPEPALRALRAIALHLGVIVGTPHAPKITMRIGGWRAVSTGAGGARRAVTRVTLRDDTTHAVPPALAGGDQRWDVDVALKITGCTMSIRPIITGLALCTSAPR